MRTINFIIFVLFLLTGINLFGQITINSKNMYGIGSIQFATDNKPSALIKPGTPGVNKTWNFSMLGEDQTGTNVYIDPDNTPCYDSFPNANLVGFYESGSNYSYDYVNLSSDSLSAFGSCNNNYLYHYSGNYFKFPIVYQWAYNQVLTVTFQSTSMTESTLFKADAWGTMITPYGNYDVLRIVSQQDTINHIYDYMWMTNKPDVKDAVVSFSYFADKDSVSAVSYFKAAYQGTPDFELCVVTVDTATGKNKLIWEPPTQAGISSFNIYKEAGANDWNLIGSLPANSIGEFTDNNSNPQVHADKYKLESVSPHGIESIIKSPYHKTINLSVSQGVPSSTIVLNWDGYEEESHTFVPQKYYIFRGSSPSTLHLYDSLSSSFTSYNDQNVTNVYYYAVGVTRPGGCNTSKGKALYFQSISNVKSSVGQGISEPVFQQSVIVFPNPAKDEITIETEQNYKTNKMICEIINTAGKTVLMSKLNNSRTTVDIKELNSGFYTIKVKSEKGITIKKFVKQ